MLVRWAVRLGNGLGVISRGAGPSGPQPPDIPIHIEASKKEAYCLENGERRDFKTRDTSPFAYLVLEYPWA